MNELESKLAALKAEEKRLTEEWHKEREAKRLTVKREWKFTFTPAVRGNIIDRLTDDTLKWYYLQGTVTNREECLAVGHGEDNVRGGGMAYLFNTGTNRVAMNSGGGNIYIVDAYWSMHRNETEECKEDAKIVYDKLGKFIAENPQGGDVTEIITAQRHFRW